jgi:hypothetical protein
MTPQPPKQLLRLSKSPPKRFPLGTKRGDALLPYALGAWRLTMQSERDVWNTTYFHPAIRKRIGETLSASYDLSQPLPDRMRALLVQLEKPSAEGASGAGKPPAAKDAEKARLLQMAEEWRHLAQLAEAKATVRKDEDT